MVDAVTWSKATLPSRAHESCSSSVCRRTRWRTYNLAWLHWDFDTWETRRS